jgi:hypothetical protein
MSNTFSDPYHSLVPIFCESSLPRRFHQVGTAVFVTRQNAFFLFTAAHVTDHLNSGELLIPTSKGFARVDGYLAHIDLLPGSRREADQVDIAYYRLREHLAMELLKQFSPIPQSRSEILSSTSKATVFSVAGYPISKAKKSGNTFKSEIYAFRGVAASLETYSKLSLSPDFNIIVHFDRQQAIDINGRVSTPGLRGVSGGGIFSWRHGTELSTDWSHTKLVGVFHSYKEREGLMIGTTLLPILGAISLGEMKGFR